MIYLLIKIYLLLSKLGKNYEGGFAADLMTKDLSLAQLASIESNSSTPLGSIAFNVFLNFLSIFLVQLTIFNLLKNSFINK